MSKNKKIIKFLNVWLDDERKPLPGYDVWFRYRVDSIVPYLIDNAESITEISFDNSLGCGVTEGHVLLDQLEAAVCADGVQFPNLRDIYIHTSDINMRKPMLHATRKIFEFCGSDGVYGRIRDYEQECQSRGIFNDKWLNEPFKGETF